MLFSSGDEVREQMEVRINSKSDAWLYLQIVVIHLTHFAWMLRNMALKDYLITIFNEIYLQIS